MIEHNPFRLLLPLEVGKDESWPWFIVRSNMHNYEHWINLPEKLLREKLAENGLKDNLFWPYTSPGIDLYSRFYHVTIDQIIHRSVHRYAKILTYPGQQSEFFEIQTATIVERYPKIKFHNPYKHITPISKIQFCPICFAENKVHKASWLLKCICSCINHHCLLIRACPSCGNEISIKTLLTGHCKFCSFDLEKAPIHAIDTSSWSFEAQKLIQDWFTSPSKIVNHNGLTPQSAYWFHYDLKRVFSIEQIRDQLVVDFKIQSNEAEQTYEYQKYYQIGLEMAVFANWPHNFLNLVSSVRRYYKPFGDYESPFKDLGYLHRLISRNWLQDAFEPIQQAFEIFFHKEYTRSFYANRSAWFKTRKLDTSVQYMSVSKAAESLSVTSSTLKGLGKIGRLKVVPAMDADKIALCLITEISQLRTQWRNSHSMVATAERLGIYKDVVRDMVDLGILEVVRGPTVDDSQKWMITQESADHFLGQVVSAIKYTEQPYEVVSIHTATKMLSIVGLNMADLLRLVMIGSVKTYLPESVDLQIHNLLFRVKDIKARIHNTLQSNGWVDRRYIANKMGVKMTVVSKWIAVGLIGVDQTYASKMYFSQSKIDEFVAKHMFTREAARQLNLNELTIQKWVRKGRLHPVSGPDIDGRMRYLFKRNEIEYWRDTTFYSAPEMAKILGISHSQFLQHVKKGMYTPISGPTVDDFKQYLFDKDFLYS
ncbi:MAG: helix-turn-helix domain-containing protein [Chloroflexota bacterium]